MNRCLLNPSMMQLTDSGPPSMPSMVQSLFGQRRCSVGVKEDVVAREVAVVAAAAAVVMIVFAVAAAIAKLVAAAGMTGVLAADAAGEL
jgi:hypothetical protein